MGRSGGVPEKTGHTARLLPPGVRHTHCRPHQRHPDHRRGHCHRAAGHLAGWDGVGVQGEEEVTGVGLGLALPLLSVSARTAGLLLGQIDPETDPGLSPVTVQRVWCRASTLVSTAVGRGMQIPSIL